MKSARVTGHVMGYFHPHGDASIYDALVRMAQSFSLRHPLVAGHGNFGSPDFGPAAARYTECRLDPLAMQMLADIDEETVDWGDNYSGEVQEPLVLPARFPNLLVNGSQGIAVGMATNIPPHNLGEVVDATVHLIDNPEATPDDLMHFVKGPDFPTGAQIMGRAGILDAYRTGKGSIKLRAVAEIVEGSGRQRDRIVVSEIPYQASINTIATKIKELVETRQIEGIADVNDASAGESTNLVIELKKDAPGARHPQQPLQAHPAAVELRHEHGGPGRRRAAHAQPQAGPRGLHRAPGRRAHPPFRVPAPQGPGAGPHRRGLPQGHQRHRRGHRHHPRAPTTARPPASRCRPSRSSSARSRPSRSST